MKIYVEERPYIQVIRPYIQVIYVKDLGKLRSPSQYDCEYDTHLALMQNWPLQQQGRRKKSFWSELENVNFNTKCCLSDTAVIAIQAAFNMLHAGLCIHSNLLRSNISFFQELPDQDR